MSWDRRSGGRSSDPDATGVATLVKVRGAMGTELGPRLVDALAGVLGRGADT